ncbi:MAG: hypothetical protein V7754_03320 [Halioglobus sp.]
MKRYPASLAQYRPALIFIECMLIFWGHWWLFHWVSWGELLPGGVDGYYHYALASLLSPGNLAQDISFLPYTYMGQNGTDHEWLLHWAQKPFTLLAEDSEYSIKNAAIAWGALLPALLNLVYRLARIPFAPVVAVVGVWCLFSLPDRYLMFRAQNLGLLFVISCQLLIGHRKYLALAVSVFIFSQAYHGVVLLALVIVSALLAQGVISRSVDRKLLVYSAAGLGLALFISPWFPQNIELLVFHLLLINYNPLGGFQLAGNEWAGLAPGDILSVTYVGLFCLSGAMVTLWLARERVVDDYRFRMALSLTFLAVFSLVLAVLHVRFLDLFGPVSCLAFAASLLLWRDAFRYRSAIVLGLGLVVSALMVYRLSTARHPELPTVDRYRNHCEYIRAHTEEGETIFNVAWGAFPQLFNCNPSITFVAGLDGNLLAYGNQDVFSYWYALNKGLTEQLDWAAFETLLDSEGIRFLFFNTQQRSSAEHLLRQSRRSEIVVEDGAGILLRY